MTNLLRKIFIKNYENIKDNEVREKHGVLASLVGVVSNLVLFAIKLLAGLITSSIAIIADSINNLSDMASSIITLVGFKLSKMPADEDHPYGHQRIEYISGLIVAIIIIFVGGNLFISSIDKIKSYEIVVIAKSSQYLSIAILTISILIKLWQSLFNRKVGKLINSLALIATSEDSRNDCISTFAILVSTIVLLIFPNMPFSLDGVMGIIVSLFIIYSGINLIKETMDPLIGVSVHDDFVKEIIAYIESNNLVLGIHDPVCHMYGPTKCFMTIHVEVNSSLNLLDIHDTIDNLEKEVLKEFGVMLTIHMDPVVVDDPLTDELKTKVKEVVCEIGSEVSFHDFRIVTGPTHTNILFDLVIPFNYKYSETELKKMFEEKVKSNDTKYYFIIEFEHDYVGR